MQEVVFAFDLDGDCVCLWQCGRLCLCLFFWGNVRDLQASVRGGFEAKDMLGIPFLRLVLGQEAARLAEMED